MKKFRFSPGTSKADVLFIDMKTGEFVWFEGEQSLESIGVIVCGLFDREYWRNYQIDFELPVDVYAYVFYSANGYLINKLDSYVSLLASMSANISELPYFRKATATRFSDEIDRLDMKLKKELRDPRFTDEKKQTLTYFAEKAARYMSESDCGLKFVLYSFEIELAPKATPEEILAEVYVKLVQKQFI